MHDHTKPAESLCFAGQSPLVPVTRTVAADTETPVSSYLKVARGRWSYLLESAEGGARWGRFSFIGLDPFLVVEARGPRVVVRRVDDGLWDEGSAGRSGGGSIAEGDDPIAALRAVLAAHRMPHTPGLPRFAGGLVGYLGFGAARLFERLPPRKPDPMGLPDIRMFAPRTMLAFDNLRATLTIIVLAPAAGGRTAYDRAQQRIDHVLAQLGGPVPGPSPTLWTSCAPADPHVTEAAARAPSGLDVMLNHDGGSAGLAAPAGSVGRPGEMGVFGPQPVMSRDRFESLVRRAKAAICAGEVVQVVLSQAFSGDAPAEPFAVYRALRALNPSPYMFHLALGDEVVVGASPEVMARVEDGRALLRPIAGTRPRGATAARDATLEAELVADEKERAEHVMLLDLGRNDLGRVAEPGGVRVEDAFTVERYSHVMHITSTVSAALRPGVDALDVLAATFPAGTVSGAPKVRALQIINALEPHERGVYAGAIGHLGFDGTADTCIAIRTMVFHEGKVHFQVGAGIVADSDPAREYDETMHKAAALRQALELAARSRSTGSPSIFDFEGVMA